MVENNAQGRQVRRYFIECERAIAQVNQSLLFQFNRAMLEFEKLKDMASDAAVLVARDWRLAGGV